jgi:hypothetical protein
VGTADSETEKVGAGVGGKVGWLVVGARVGGKVGCLVVGAGVGRKVGWLVVGAGVGRKVGWLVVGAGVGRKVGWLVVGAGFSEVVVFTVSNSFITVELSIRLSFKMPKFPDVMLVPLKLSTSISLNPLVNPSRNEPEVKRGSMDTQASHITDT